MDRRSEGDFGNGIGSVGEGLAAARGTASWFTRHFR
jgi:hypothetical protein